MGRSKPTLVQLETQGRLTLALLPLVSALPFVDEEAIVRTFGLTMAILNWIPPLPVVVTRPVPELPEWPKKTGKTEKERRMYWREAKRKERRRKRAGAVLTGTSEQEEGGVK